MFLQWRGFQGDGSRIFWKGTEPRSGNFDTQKLKQIVKLIMCNGQRFTIYYLPEAAAEHEAKMKKNYEKRNAKKAHNNSDISHELIQALKL